MKLSALLEDFPTAAFTAVIGGAGLGLLATVGLQNVFNHYQAQTCKKMPEYHRLITFSTALGDSKYCMHIRYLAN